MNKENYLYYHEIVFPNTRFPIMIYFHDIKYGYVTHHWHRSFELADYISSPCRFWKNGVACDVPADTLLFVNSGDIHAYLPHNLKNPNGVSLIFPYDFMKEYGINLDHTYFDYIDNPKINNQLLSSLHAIADLRTQRESDPYYYILCSAEIFKILHLLVTYYRTSKPDHIVSLKYLERCQKLISYVEDHYHEPLSLESVSEYMGLAPGYLCRFFKKNLGMTFKQHLTGVRLQHATQKMEHDDRSLLYIAMSCGFPDYRSFVNSFRTTYEITPQEYRNKFIFYREKYRTAFMKDESYLMAKK